MFPMQRKVLDNPVVVEYDCGKHRRRKVCHNAFAARSFYAQKFKAGKNPSIIKDNDNEQSNAKS